MRRLVAYFVLLLPAFSALAEPVAPVDSKPAQIVSVAVQRTDPHNPNEQSFAADHGVQEVQTDVVLIEPGTDINTVVAEAKKIAAATRAMNPNNDAPIPVTVMGRDPTGHVADKRMHEIATLLSENIEGVEKVPQIEPTAEMLKLLARPDGATPYEKIAETQRRPMRYMIVATRVVLIGGAAWIAFTVAKFSAPTFAACMVAAVAFTGTMQYLNSLWKNYLNAKAPYDGFANRRSRHAWVRRFWKTADGALPFVRQNNLFLGYYALMEVTKAASGTAIRAFTNPAGWVMNAIVAKAAAATASEAPWFVYDAKVRQQRLFENYVRYADNPEEGIKHAKPELRNSDLRTIGVAVWSTVFQLMALAEGTTIGIGNVEVGVAQLGISVLWATGIAGGVALVGTTTDWFERLGLKGMARRVGLSRMFGLQDPRRAAVEELSKDETPVVEIGGATACANAYAE